MLMYRWYTHAYILSFLLPDLVFTASQEESQIPVGFFSVNNGIVSECLPRFVLFVELAALNPLCGSTEGYYWSWWPFKSVMGQVFSGWDLLPSLKCLVQFSALDSDSIFFSASVTSERQQLMTSSHGLPPTRETWIETQAFGLWTSSSVCSLYLRWKRTSGLICWVS